MKFISEQGSHDCNYAIALGNFDGLHLGHRAVIETAKIKAQHFNCKSAVLTFWPHPMKVLRGGLFYEILSLEEKVARIKSIGIDEVLIIDFSREFSEMSAEGFIKNLCQRLKIKSITTGYNFRFGHNRHGNIETLHRLKKFYGFKYNAINQIFVEGSIVSSSLLRKIIQMGCMQLFSELTGNNYSLESITSSNPETLKLIQELSGDEVVFVAAVLDKSVLMPPAGVYLAKSDEDYFTLFLMEDKQLFLVPINQKTSLLSKIFKLELLQIIKQYKTLDNSTSSSILVKSSIKGVKFCLGQKK